MYLQNYHIYRGFLAQLVSSKHYVALEGQVQSQGIKSELCSLVTSCAKFDYAKHSWKEKFPKQVSVHINMRLHNRE